MFWGKQSALWIMWKWEGCPILRQIYAWHCVVLTSDKNTAQKNNNKERSKAITNLTMLCINLLGYWTSVRKWGVSTSFLIPRVVPGFCRK